MTEAGIFGDEWRECLRAQYMYVVRNDDQRTLKTLKGVMHEVGFSDDELRDLYVRATMRAEDMPDDFLPATELLKMEVVPEMPPVSEPGPEPAYDESDDDEPPPASDSGAVQLSLF
jgi:hypothetical protein